MRLSSDLPPAGFTRAEPRPPARARRLPPPRPAIAAVLLAAGLFLAIGYGTIPAAPARTMRPDAPAPSATPPAASTPSPSGAAPAPDDVSSASHEVTRKKPSRRSRAVPRRAHRPRTPRPSPATRPRATRDTRPARPAVPSWVIAECRRRFPDDPRRRAACVAVLTEMFGS